MEIPKLVYEKKELVIDRDLQKHNLLIGSKNVKVKDDLLEGREAIEKKPVGKEVKGANNYYLGKGVFGYKYTK